MRGSVPGKYGNQKVQQDMLLTVPNSEYKKLVHSFSHLRSVFIDNDDTKVELTLHIVLGASNVLKRKTNIQARVGKIGESVVELTKFGWMVMSPGQEDHSNMYLTESTTRDYELLY